MKLTQIQNIGYDFLKTLAPNSWEAGVSFKWWLDYDNKNEYRIVPEGFKTNLGSVPPLLHFIADDDDFPIAFTGHDYDYSPESFYVIKSLDNLSPKMKKWIKYGTLRLTGKQIIFIPNRKFADLVLFDTIQIEGLSKIRSRLVYFGVRVGGKSHYIPNKPINDMPLNTSGTATGVVLNTFGTHVGVKSITAIFILLLERILVGNELLLMFIFLLYFVDFILGLVVAVKRSEFCLSKFFMGASKILMYGILILIGISLDESLHTGQFFIGLLIAFIVVTDSISILKKLRILGYNTPMFLEKYLISYKEKLDEKFTSK